MQEPSRRSLIKNAAKVAVGVTGGAMLTKAADAKTTRRLEKKAYPPSQPGKKQLFSSAVSYGNLLFLSGEGAHFKGTIQEHTQYVLNELQKTLVSAGSSMEKVLKVNVYLNDLNDYDAMNKVYLGAPWGDIPPVRTTVAPAGGIPGKSLVEIDLIAYI